MGVTAWIKALCGWLQLAICKAVARPAAASVVSEQLTRNSVTTRRQGFVWSNIQRMRQVESEHIVNRVNPTSVRLRRLEHLAHAR